MPALSTFWRSETPLQACKGEPAAEKDASVRLRPRWLACRAFNQPISTCQECLYSAGQKSAASGALALAGSSSALLTGSQGQCIAEPEGPKASISSSVGLPQVSPEVLNVPWRESSRAREAVRCEAGGAVLGRDWAQQAQHGRSPAASGCRTGCTPSATSPCARSPAHRVRSVNSCCTDSCGQLVHKPRLLPSS